jgi:hypothetical protein
MTRRVIVLEEAAHDIEAAIDFYEAADPGVGDYFRDRRKRGGQISGG